MIWLHVAPPPAEDQPGSVRGRTPRSDITERQLHRKKADILRLIALFVVSVKHYVREEDGLHWEDYQDFVPTWFLRYAFTSVPGSYDATQPNSMSASMLTTTGATGTESTPVTPGGTLRPKGDATKRVRPKRSKQKMPTQAPNDTTRLLSETQRAINFFESAEETLPLPLMYTPCSLCYMGHLSNGMSFQHCP
jgi:ion channel-forming bestrophin family protein